MEIPKQIADPVPAIVEVVHTDSIAIESRPSRCPLVRPGKPSSAVFPTSLDSLKEPVCNVIHEDFFDILAAGHAAEPVLDMAEAVSQEIGDSGTSE